MNRSSMKNQQGAALAVGLILLLIITLMGYTGMKGTMLQEKMAAGLHNRSLAAGGANSALREGERFLYHLVEITNGVVPEGTPEGELYGIYSYYAQTGQPTSGVNPNIAGFLKKDFTSTAGTEHSHDFVGVSEQGAALQQNPEYMIYQLLAGSATLNTQEFGEGGTLGEDQKTYIVTGKSTSGDGKTMSIVQSLYTVVGSSNPSQ